VVFGGKRMLRIGLSGVLGFILMYVESLIVMKLKGTATIEFGEIAPFMSIWAMNFFFVFAILTHAGAWFQNRVFSGNNDENHYF
jgi:hypothetical protein